MSGSLRDGLGRGPSTDLECFEFHRGFRGSAPEVPDFMVTLEKKNQKKETKGSV